MSVKRPAALTTLALAAAVTLAGCGGGTQEEAAPTTSTTRTTESPRTTAPGTPAQGEHNDADVAFTQGMIPHHAQAIAMSDMLLAKDGVDERVRSLAERIKAAQAPEIQEMTGWLRAWGSTVPHMGSSGGMGPSGMGTSGMGTSGMGGGHGMMSEGDMHALAQADGATASRLFLEQMIAHHRGAIQMAQTELADGANPDAKDLAQKIIDTQQAEITQMENLLKEL